MCRLFWSLVSLVILATIATTKKSNNIYEYRYVLCVYMTGKNMQDWSGGWTPKFSSYDLALFCFVLFFQTSCPVIQVGLYFTVWPRSLELVSILLFILLSAGIVSVCHHAGLELVFFKKRRLIKIQVLNLLDLRTVIRLKIINDLSRPNVPKNIHFHFH